MKILKTVKMESNILSATLALVLFFTGLGLSRSSSDFQFWYRSTWQILALEWLFILFYFTLTRRISPLFMEILHAHRQTAFLVGLWAMSLLTSYVFSPVYSHGNLLVLMRLAETFTHLIFFVVLWDFFSRYRANFTLIFLGAAMPSLLMLLFLGTGLLGGGHGIGIWGLPLPHWGTLHLNDNIRRIGYQLVVAMVLFFYFLSSKKFRRLCSILIGLMGISLLWLGGRAAILGILSAVFFYIITTKRSKSLGKSIRLIAITSLAVFSAAHFHILNMGRLGTMLERTFHASSIDQMSTGRIKLWSMILDQWSRHPWLGLGPQSCFFLPGHDRMIIHAHNFLLQFLEEWGLIGTLLFLLLLYRLLRYGWKIYRHDPRPDIRNVKITAASLILALTVIGLFGGNYFFAQTSLLLVLAYATWASSPSDTISN